MAYHLVDKEFASELAKKLDDGAGKVRRYLLARSMRDELRLRLEEAQRQYEEAARDVEDHLLGVLHDVNRVERHEKGEVWW